MGKIKNTILYIIFLESYHTLEMHYYSSTNNLIFVNKFNNKNNTTYAKLTEASDGKL